MDTPKVGPLKALEGSTILAVVPWIDPFAVQQLKLHMVEESGLWVESQAVMDMIYKRFSAQRSSRAPVFFLPWHQIAFVMGSPSVAGVTSF